MHLHEIDGDETRLAPHAHDREFSPLAKLSAFNFSSSNPLEDNDYYRFSFVRNPYTRVLSAFLDRLGPNNPIRHRYMRKLGLPADADLSFMEFLKIISESNPRRHNKHWMPLTLVMQIGKINYDFIGRFENFTGDFNHVLTKVYNSSYNDKRHRRAHHAVNAGDKIRETIRSNEKALIDKIYEQDFNNFNYSKDLNDV
jgi:hypothetical protein